MNKKTVTVRYMIAFPIILIVCGLIAIGFPLYSALFHAVDAQGALVTFSVGELIIFLGLGAVVLVYGFTLFRFKIVAGEQVEFTPYFGKKQILEYKDFVKSENVLFGIALFTKEKKITTVTPYMIHRQDFYKRLPNLPTLGMRML